MFLSSFMKFVVGIKCLHDNCVSSYTEKKIHIVGLMKTGKLFPKATVSLMNWLMLIMTDIGSILEKR